MTTIVCTNVSEVIDPEPGQEGQLWITLMTGNGQPIKQLGPVTWEELRCIVDVCRRELEAIGMGTP